MMIEDRGLKQEKSGELDIGFGNMKVVDDFVKYRDGNESLSGRG